MLIKLLSGCGDLVLMNLDKYPSLKDRDSLRSAIIKTTVGDQGKFFYTTLGSEQDESWDRFLESYGFTKVGEVCNSAHKGDRPMRAYFLQSNKSNVINKGDMT